MLQLYLVRHDKVIQTNTAAAEGPVVRTYVRNLQADHARRALIQRLRDRPTNQLQVLLSLLNGQEPNVNSFHLAAVITDRRLRAATDSMAR